MDREKMPPREVWGGALGTGGEGEREGDSASQFRGSDRPQYC